MESELRKQSINIGHWPILVSSAGKSRCARRLPRGVFEMVCIELRPAPKWGEEGLYHRVISPEQTFQRIRPLMRLIEVTRVADLTGLSRVGIPVLAAVRPCADSPGVDTHYGKGLTKIDASVSAMMEAVERYSAERLNCRPVRGVFEEIARNDRALDPHLMYLYSEKPFNDRISLEWVSATELLGVDEIMVPANFVCSPVSVVFRLRILVSTEGNLEMLAASATSTTANWSIGTFLVSATDR